MEKLPENTKEAAKQIVDQAWNQYDGKRWREFRSDVLREIEDKGKK